VNVGASVIFAGMSGAAVADAGGLGAIEIKAMRDAKYDDDFAVGITAASSTIGPIIPPSLPMVIYGVWPTPRSASSSRRASCRADHGAVAHDHDRLVSRGGGYPRDQAFYWSTSWGSTFRGPSCRC
jgi:hypothetical protein